MDYVIAPIGAFGNHVRWLLLLSNKYSFLGCNSITDKVNFIKEKVYSENRSWHNWLKYEWTFRNGLDKIIKFSHELNTMHEDKFKDSKFISLTIDWELSYKCYFKINCYLNELSSYDYMVMINNHNKVSNLANKKDNRILTIKSDDLFKKELDRDIYNSMINWFDLEDCYEFAKEIHTMWYNLHLKSEKEFVRDITKLYNKIS